MIMDQEKRLRQMVEANIRFKQTIIDIEKDLLSRKNVDMDFKEEYITLQMNRLVYLRSVVEYNNAFAKAYA